MIPHDLPGRAQLAEIARGIGTEPGELPEGPELETLLDAACGLTRHEAESAFSLSLVRHARLQPDAVWELKTQTLKKSGLLTLHRGTEDFNSLGGLAALKAFCRRSMLQPGRGKSAQAAARVPGPGLLAQVIVSKSGEHMSCYRQEDVLGRHGVEIPRQIGKRPQRQDNGRPLQRRHEREGERRRIVGRSPHRADDAGLELVTSGKHRT